MTVAEANQALRAAILADDIDGVEAACVQLDRLGARPNPSTKPDLPDGCVVVRYVNGRMEQKTHAAARMIAFSATPYWTTDDIRMDFCLPSPVKMARMSPDAKPLIVERPTHSLPDDFPGRRQLIAAGYTTMDAVRAIRDFDEIDGIGEVTESRIIERLQKEG